MLVGFNRPDLIHDRLKEFETMSDLDLRIHISVDGPRTGNHRDKLAQEEIRKLIDSTQIDNEVVTFFSKENKGCDVHIFDSISRVISESDYLIVVEDDVKISKSGIENLIRKAEKVVESKLLNPIVTMSGLSSRSFNIKNRWRTSSYFSAWGYAINKDFWKLHTEVMKIYDEEFINEKFSNSKWWTGLPQRKREIWRERISRGNYDYGIQRTLILENIKTYAPVFRISDNVGHGLAQAAHTRFKAPAYLKNQVFEKISVFARDDVNSSLINRVLNWTDGQTWAGDGLFSVRGRTWGLRTILRRMFSK